MERGKNISRRAGHVGKEQDELSLDLIWVDEVAVKHEESSCF